MGLVGLSVGVTTDGELDELDDMLSGVENIPGELAEAAGNSLRSIATGLAAVDTGALRDSITLSVNKGPGYGIAAVAPGVPYAVYVEYGTGRRGHEGGGGKTYTLDWQEKVNPATGEISGGGMAPRPFMHPAYEAVVKDFGDKLREALWAAWK